MWRFSIQDEQGVCLMRSALIPFANVAHLDRIIKYHIQEIVFDPTYPILGRLSPKLKRTLKNWIL